METSIQGKRKQKSKIFFRCELTRKYNTHPGRYRDYRGAETACRVARHERWYGLYVSLGSGGDGGGGAVVTS